MKPLLGFGLLALGGLLIAGGLVAVALSDDTHTTHVVGAPDSTSTPPTSRGTGTSQRPDAGTTSSTIQPAPTETAREFFAALATAFRAGDVAFLYARLDPRVFERYDATQCRTFLAGLDVPKFKNVVVAVERPASWTWITDGVTRKVPAATTVRTRNADDGVTFRVVNSHVVVDDRGRVRWFTDCGSPKVGAR